jgi:hypothetical protein
MDFCQNKYPCSSCHQDIHQGFLDKKYYGERSCEACHQVESWQKITFDHKTTGYELKGGHSTAQCASCHFDKSVNPATQKFKGLSKQCASCHANIHGNQFEQKALPIVLGATVQVLGTASYLIMIKLLSN